MDKRDLQRYGEQLIRMEYLHSLYTCTKVITTLLKC